MSVATAMPPGQKRESFLDGIADSFAAAGVRYCQWKGHWKRARWIAGHGDADLVVSPESLSTMLDILHTAGFRATVAPEDHRMPGTWHYRAPDPATGQLVHIHVHTRILVEGARGTIYRFPVEEAMLASSRPGELFPTPAPELEALVLVLRTTVRWASWRRVPTETREELGYLEQQTDSHSVLAALARHLPAVDPETYRRCRRALERRATRRDRWVARRGLTRALRAFAQLPTFVVRVAHAVAAAAWHLRGGPRPYSRARLNGGGILVALVGTDGSGKSTCTHALKVWLTPHVLTRAFHVGRPPRSLLTLVVGALRKVLPVAPVNWLRQLCTARDRYRLVTRASHWALDGGVALTERYPIGLDHALVGPRIRELAGANPGALARRLTEIEEGYYRRMPAPDHIFVLDVDPDVAVRRKTDEPSDYVRARAEAMQQVDWSDSTAHVIDASVPLSDVIATLKAAVWKAL